MNILDLGPAEFLAALDELGIVGEQRDALVSQYTDPSRGYERDERPFLTRLADNVIGFDDGVETQGERIGQSARTFFDALREDPLGTAGGMVSDLYGQVERGVQGELTPFETFELAGILALPTAGARFDPNVARMFGGRGTTAPRDFGFTRDNPGGDWLRNKQERADEAMAESSRGLRRRGVTGSVTGTMGMQTDMFLPTDRLSSLTGLMDENRRPGDLQFDELMARVREEGFDPNQAGNRIVIAVNHRGEPFVLEGNTRIAVARELGIPNVKAEVRYWNGAEDVDGPFAPENVSRIATGAPEY
jgi:hypothetical protein